MSSIKNDLEAYMDTKDLESLMDIIVEICYEKADHVASNWQDKELANAWKKRAMFLEKAIAGIKGQPVF